MRGMQPSSIAFSPFDDWSYSLLLGFYLGDGCVASTGTSWQLRVTLDGLYPDVIDTCAMAITLSLRDSVNVHAYPRYFYENRSADVRGLFCQSCDRLGIRWTQSNPRNISVSHRDSVAVLGTFVGPKT